MIEQSGSRGRRPLPQEATLARLRWRCRRGMRELDAVLQAFLERSGATLTAAELCAFERVLELPDPELYGYVVGRGEPADPAIAAFVARLRAARP